VEDVTLSNSSAGIELAGTLTVPDEKEQEEWKSG